MMAYRCNIFYSFYSFIILLQSLTTSNICETSPAKLTGTRETQEVAHIGEKRLLLYCDDELHHNMIIPKRVKITYSDDKIISYEELERS